jgi:hypothetical protein
MLPTTTSIILRTNILKGSELPDLNIVKLLEDNTSASLHPLSLPSTTTVLDLSIQLNEFRPQMEALFLPLRETFRNKRVLELKSYLTDYGLDTTGKKAALIARCEKHYALQYEAFCNSLKDIQL